MTKAGCENLPAFPGATPSELSSRSALSITCNLNYFTVGYLIPSCSR